MNPEILRNIPEKVVKNKFTRALTAVIAVGSGFSVACGEDELKAGVVTDKKYEERREWLLPILVGKVIVVIPRVDDEDWILEIENCTTKSGQDSSCKTSKLYVSEEIFDQTEIGEYVDFDDSNDQEVSTEDPVERREE